MRRVTFIAGRPRRSYVHNRLFALADKRRRRQSPIPERRRRLLSPTHKKVSPTNTQNKRRRHKIFVGGLSIKTRRAMAALSEFFGLDYSIIPTFNLPPRDRARKRDMAYIHTPSSLARQKAWQGLPPILPISVNGTAFPQRSAATNANSSIFCPPAI